MRKTPLLDLKAQYRTIRREVEQAVMGVLESGRYILGPEVEAFEQEVARFTGTRYGIGVANGTDALLLTLDAAGIGPGDEVITSPFTFFATAEVISRLGAKPVFVDIDPNTYNLDVSQLEAKRTEKTRAIVPVHIFGQPADMDEINRFAEACGLFVLEDAAQAFGSDYKGRKAGSLGHAATFSFFPTKNLGGYGDGGMVVTDNEELTAGIRSLRVHGRSHRSKYHNARIGYNSRLDELQAAVLRIKLKYLESWNRARREKARLYDRMLKGLPVVTPTAREDRTHIYHLYIVQSEDRDALLKGLQERGIGVGSYYPVPLHLQEVYRDLGYQEGDLPRAEAISKRSFALPLYPEMDEEMLQGVVEAVKAFYR
ncbi:DegT/DnrJ/EryC1/StrS family aminotransferase [Paludifilum halophilum]|uniref:Transcriptional regulator n=1 Tax=Paludifilum halophilum TaxID=1642702 RepID=A0A235B6V4_9BACL|nr:DegT/DnrJ/EryC1/StrS family aminotransferase [Paludifilum halophilum]OYD08038.1 transcriptional regulator [Paludifilum halophilum]